MTAPGFERTVALESLRIVTPLGIRFWDPVLNVQISDGLIVSAYPQEDCRQVAAAVRTLSGIYAFHHLPGLQAVEYPGDSVDYALASPPFARSFIIQVTDEQRRFLPATFSVPAPFQGVFPTGLERTNARPPGVYLFSAPTRPVTPNLAVVRAQLMVSAGLSVQPAAHAVLEIQTPRNQLWYGLADEQGSVMVVFPYPVFTAALGGITSSPPPLCRQQWSLRIQVRYRPSMLVWPPGSRQPDLSSLFRQPLVDLWRNRLTPVSQLIVQLGFGEELVLRTEAESILLINPAMLSP
jgi:hypothetical protein